MMHNYKDEEQFSFYFFWTIVTRAEFLVSPEIADVALDKLSNLLHLSF